MARIVLADDHAVLRQGIKALLDAQQGGWEIIGEASNGLELMPILEKLTPDILILDLSMPNLGGIEALYRIEKLRCKPAVLVLSARDDERSVREAMRAGAKGFIPKSASMDELSFALQALSKGQSYLSPSVAAGVLSRGPDGELPSSPLDPLSAREREIMKLLCEGLPNRNIAKTLHISPRTVDTHRANIMKKLNVSSNAELVQIALRSGLVE